MFVFHQATLMPKKYFVLKKEQRTFPKKDLGNSDIVIKKNGFFVLIFLVKLPIHK